MKLKYYGKFFDYSSVQRGLLFISLREDWFDHFAIASGFR